MTLDHAVALSLLENLRRVNLTERLKNDPHLLEQATPLLEQAREVRERAERAAIQVIPWNDPNFPTSLATLTDLPPVLWYQGLLCCRRVARNRDRWFTCCLGRRHRNGIEAGS